MSPYHHLLFILSPYFDAWNRNRTSSMPLPSYIKNSKNESVVELVELHFTCSLLNRFREPPARAYVPEHDGVGKDKPDGNGRVVGHLSIEN